ncbi:MAG: hypothetical protein WCG20_03555 [bacterium]
MILALPIGPGAYLVIRQGIGKPFGIVLKTAMMCILADFVITSALCLFGTWSVGSIDFLIEHQDTIKMLVGPILIFIGLYVIRSMIIIQKPVSSLSKVFFVALISPTTPPAVITFIFFFIGKDYFMAPWHIEGVVVLGIVLGEIISWIIGISMFHRLIKQGRIKDNFIPMLFSVLFLITGTYFILSHFI